MHSVYTRAGALVLAAAALGLCGCGSTRLEAQDAANVHAIQLTGFAEPHYRLQGRFVLKTYNVEPKGGDSFSDAMAKAGLHLGAEMKAAIAQSLRDDGYQVDDAAAADAILEVEFGGAPPNSDPMYEAAGAGFKPEYSVNVRLRDARTKKSLFHQFYVYRDNSISPIDGTILLKPDAQYEFQNADAIAADPKRAADGFRAAIPLVAGSVGTLLKH